MNELVTVAHFAESYEAEIVRGRLESSGIQSFVRGGQTVRHLNGSRGVELQVSANDVDAARSVLSLDLSGYDEQLAALQAGAGGEAGEVESFHPDAACPRCGSEDVVVTKFDAGTMLFAILLLGVPLLFLKRRHECALCGYLWRR